MIPAVVDRTPISELKLNPINVELHDRDDKTAISRHLIRFTPITLENILNGGKTSPDNGFTYSHLAALSQDYNGLVSEYGYMAGTTLYLLPTSWKAGFMIEGMERTQEKKLPMVTWLMSDEDDKTVGVVSLSQIENTKFEIEGNLKDSKLYNIGAFLHSNFQRRGVITELSKQIFDKLGEMNLDIDGLWIMTRPDNNAVNNIARKLHFIFLKEMDVKREGSFSWIQKSSKLNLYVKSL